MMGTKQPALEQGGNAVNTWQWFMGLDLGAKDDIWIVVEPIALQCCVNRRSIRAHPGSMSPLLALPVFRNCSPSAVTGFAQGIATGIAQRVQPRIPKASASAPLECPGPPIAP